MAWAKVLFSALIKPVKVCFFLSLLVAGASNTHYPQGHVTRRKSILSNWDAFNELVDLKASYKLAVLPVLSHRLKTSLGQELNGLDKSITLCPRVS